MTTKITVYFDDWSVPLTCFNLINEAFFVKKVQLWRYAEVVVRSSEKIDDDARPMVIHLLSEDVYDYLERKVVSETETQYQSTYAFNEKGIAYLDGFPVDSIEKLLLVFDCLDIKPILVALMQYLGKKKPYPELLAQVRAKRYALPEIYVK